MALLIAASSASRSRSETTDRIERLSASLRVAGNRRANSELVREIFPALSTAAIAIGVDWKKRMKRTSAERAGSAALPCARLRTSVRDAPGVPSAPNATLWNRRTGSVRPERVLKSRSITSVFTSPGAAPSVVRRAAPLPETMSDSISPPEPTWARS